MALDHILHKIHSNAQAESEKIIEQAGIRAREIIDDWKSRARAAASNINLKYEAEIERMLRQAGADARLEAGKKVLALKRKWLNEVTETARGRLISDNPARYRQILSSMIEEHVDNKTSGVTLSADEEAQKFAKELRNRQGLKISTAGPDEDPKGGILVRRGKVTVNLSISCLMEEISSGHQVEIHGVLFGEKSE